MTDGLLTVAVGEGNDTISVVANPSSQTIEVRDAGQLVQQFALGDVKNLALQSSTSNLLSPERVAIDSGLALPVQFNPNAAPAFVGAAFSNALDVVDECGDAHTVGGLDATSHLNASSTLTAKTLVADGESSSGSALGLASAGSLYSLSHLNAIGSSHQIANQSTGGSNSLTNTVSAEHISDHSPLLVTNGSSANSSHHESPSETMTATTSSADTASSNLIANVARSGARDGAGSGRHHLGGAEGSKEKTDLAQKFCTTTFYTKQLITNVDRKPECGCEDGKKSSGTDNLFKSGATEEPTLIVNFLSGREARTCRPNARDFQLGLMTEFEICSERPVDEVIREIVGEADIAEQASADLAAIHVDEATWQAGSLLSDGSWLERMRFMGWVLVAAGAALVPMLMLRSREERPEYMRQWGVECVWRGGCGREF